MKRTKRLGGIFVCAALVAAAFTTAGPALAADQCGGSGAVTPLAGTLPDGATYKIECPAGPWNGTLFLYSHGYVTPGSPNPARDAGDPVTAGFMLAHGFALAGSSYSTTGWAIQQALPDQISTLDVFDQTFGTPTHTVAWGHSLGGIITAGLIQQYPDRFSGALPMCGVLAGGVATWNTSLDGEYAFQQLIDPSVQIVNITNPSANLNNAEQAAAQAQATPQGRARLALAAALGDTPGWFDPLSPEPAPSAFGEQERNQFSWDTQVDFPFVFAFRAELEARAGGNPSWNTGVDYAVQLAKSDDLLEVLALYQAAGLSLTKDLATLNSGARVSADASAADYLEHNISFTGQLTMPVLTMHTTGDGLVIPQNEQAYSSVVDQAGDQPLLQQTFVHRAGHCTFTPAETITAVQVLMNRVDSGQWDFTALDPANLNGAAAALGPNFNIFSVGGQVKAVAPAFERFQPTLYPRPFAFGDPIGG
ncbi:MAG TPA: prolyl oligopeptidase family serine peptidase [Streptosporangiaceae bacterium]